VHQFFLIVTSLLLLLPVIQTIFFFGAEIFNPQKKKSTKKKCLLFRPKPQKFHTAEITGYTGVSYKSPLNILCIKFNVLYNKVDRPVVCQVAI
jgi:hypothetical protein